MWFSCFNYWKSNIQKKDPFQYLDDLSEDEKEKLRDRLTCPVSKNLCPIHYVYCLEEDRLYEKDSWDHLGCMAGSTDQHIVSPLTRQPLERVQAHHQQAPRFQQLISACMTKQVFGPEASHDYARRKTAAELLHRATRLKDAVAMHAVAMHYYYGTGEFPCHRGKAWHFAKKSHQLMHMPGTAFLGFMQVATMTPVPTNNNKTTNYHHRRRQGEGVALIATAAAAGVMVAQLHLAKIYAGKLRQSIYSIDYSLAEQWLAKVLSSDHDYRLVLHRRDAKRAEELQKWLQTKRQEQQDTAIDLSTDDD